MTDPRVGALFIYVGMITICNKVIIMSDYWSLFLDVNVRNEIMCSSHLPRSEDVVDVVTFSDDFSNALVGAKMEVSTCDGGM